MMGLLDPRLMAYLQQRGIQAPAPRPQMPTQMPRPQMPRPMQPNPMMGQMPNPLLPAGSTFVPAQMNIARDPASYVMPPRPVMSGMNMARDPRSYVMPRR